MQRAFEQRTSVTHTSAKSLETDHGRQGLHSLQATCEKTMIVYLKCCLLCCRSHAIACVNQFIISRTQALMLHIDPFIEASLTACFFFFVPTWHAIISLPVIIIAYFSNYMLQPWKPVDILPLSLLFCPLLRQTIIEKKLQTFFRPRLGLIWLYVSFGMII